MTQQPPPQPQQPYGQQPPPAYYGGPPPKKSHTLRNVLLGIVLVLVLVVGGCLALFGAAVNEVDKAIDEKASKEGGSENPIAVTEGEAFSIGDFDYAEGWSVAQQYGMVHIKNLKVTNAGDERDGVWIEIKFWQGTEALAVSDCITEQIPAGTTTNVDCSSADRLPKSYDKITFNDTF